jgi:acetyl esterase/lipase
MHEICLATMVGIFWATGGLTGCTANSTASSVHAKGEPATVSSRVTEPVASPQPAPIEKTICVFKKTPDCDIHADVYRPPNVSSPTPAIVYIHGGALMMGSRAGINGEQLKAYLGAGYTVISIDYRLAPEVKLPVIIEDLKDAFRWVRENAPGLFPIDPQRIAVTGHSAGGYLTLMSGFCVSPRPKVLVAFYGYGDIAGDWVNKPDPFYTQQPAVTREAAYRCVGGQARTEPRNDKGPYYLYCRQQGLWGKEVTGHDPVEEPSAFISFCPLRNISAKYPPTLLLHGDKDTDVPYAQSVAMDAGLSRLGVEHQLITIPGGKHGFDGDMKNPVVRDAFDAVLAFLKKHL